MVELLYKELTFAVIGAAMEVHKVLGPGFLESVYQSALARELTLRGIPFDQQIRLPVTYKDVLVGEYIADFVVDGKLIVELKAMSKLTQVIKRKPCIILPRQVFTLLSCSTLVLAL